MNRASTLSAGTATSRPRISISVSLCMTGSIATAAGNLRPTMSSRAWILFAAVSVIWGVPYLFIKIAIDGGASPLLVAWGRVAIGAALLLPIAWKMGYLGRAAGGARSR